MADITPTEDLTVFKAFPKIARLNREVCVSEKLDGTNAQLVITPDGQLLTGSRNRWLTPESDNHGFAKWAQAHKDELRTLGPGRHFGEWWGNGIQRGYGLPQDDKRFSMFNVVRWCLHGETPKLIPQPDPRVEKYQDVLPECCGLVPVLWHGMFSTEKIAEIITSLRTFGSHAVPGFMHPEGVVVWHTSANMGFKVTLEHDESPKSKVRT